MDNPAWADCIKVRPSGGPKCGLPAHEDCSPIDPVRVAEALEPGGFLGLGHKEWESRPGQVEMLKGVVRSFNNRTHLVVEAGTGVGKSLAYLLPAVTWASVNDTPVVISTATRNLQSQLIAKDIPRAISTLDAQAAENFRVAVLKGRNNYICLRELSELMRDGYYALSPDERLEADILVEWLVKTQTGDLDELGCTLLRPRLCCSGEDCMGRRCPYYARCFVQKARDLALHAHLIVANHTLVMAEATSAGAGLLPAYGRLIFDEAHNLEDILTNYLSFEFSRQSLNQLLNRFERHSKKRHTALDTTKGFIGSILRHLRHGALAQSDLAEDLQEQIKKARVAARFVSAAGDELLDVLTRLFSPAPHDTMRIRFRMADQVRQYALRGLFAAYNPNQWDESALGFVLLNFEDRLARLANAVLRIGETLSRTAKEGELQLYGDLIAQSMTLADAMREYLYQTKGVLAAADPDRVCWAERGGSYGILICSSPLSIAAEMKRLFWDTKDTVVLCSATLRCGADFGYAAHKLGFDLIANERIRMLVAPSPFDYFRQALVLAPAYLPDPASNSGDCIKQLPDFLSDLFATTHGRALVLFTAYDMMRSVAESMRPQLEALDLKLLVQGENVSREGMVQALMNAGKQNPGEQTPGVVLFGAQSFWEGVDIPGEALSCVVIARLPFPQAGEPIVEARCERIEQCGGSPFRDYMMPEAIVRFRQGFGRLIRTKKDRGLVVITDSRIVNKNYGARFRQALPTAVHTVSTPEAFKEKLSFTFFPLAIDHANVISYALHTKRGY